MKIKIWLFLLAALITTNAFAVKIPNLYQAQIFVESQASESRKQAVKDGLLQVLTKLSSDPTIDLKPDIQENLQKADYFVQEYSYSVPNMSEAQFLLSIKYEQEDINRLLKKADIKVWGAERPLILAWIAIAREKKAPEVVGSESLHTQKMLDVLQGQSKKLGLPIIFPMMDVKDLAVVSTPDVEKLSLDVLQPASARYAPEAILMGNISYNKKRYQSNWRLQYGDKKWTWEIADKEVNQITDYIFYQVSKTLLQNEIKKDKLPEVRLKLIVKNIDQGHDLDTIIKYLQQMTGVKEAKLAQVSGDTAEFSVLIAGGANIFQQTAAQNSRLILKSQGETANNLVYEWIP